MRALPPRHHLRFLRGTYHTCCQHPQSLRVRNRFNIQYHFVSNNFVVRCVHKCSLGDDFIYILDSTFPSGNNNGAHKLLHHCRRVEALQCTGGPQDSHDSQERAETPFNSQARPRSTSAQRRWHRFRILPRPDQVVCYPKWFKLVRSSFKVPLDLFLLVHGNLPQAVGKVYAGPCVWMFVNRAAFNEII